MGIMATLEVAIGIVLVYLVLSLVCTSLLEVIISVSGVKKNNLRDAIERLLGKDLTEKFYDHKDVAALKRSDDDLPSYIPTEVFARSVLDLATDGQWRKGGGLPNLLREQLVTFGATRNPRTSNSQQQPSRDEQARSNVGKTLIALLDEANGDLRLFQNKIELWFERTNDRSKGWFKRKINTWLICVGFVVALATNSDTIQIFQRLSEDPELRAAAVDIAEEQIQRGGVVTNATLEIVSTNLTGDANKVILTNVIALPPMLISNNSVDRPLVANIREKVGEIAPLIGWSLADSVVEAVRENNVRTMLWAIPSKFFGLLFTAFAISLGAPFWFEILQKLVSLRKSVVAARPEDLSKPPRDENSGGDGKGRKDGGGESGASAATDDTNPLEVSGPMPGFTPTAAILNVGNAYWLAKAAAVAYETNTGTLEATIESWGMSHLPLDSKGVTIEIGALGVEIKIDVQGFVAFDDQSIIVCFRGTEPKKAGDVITDLRFRLVPANECGEGMIHDGFSQALKAVWSQLEEHIKAVGGNRQPVWFTGHSLGGALAVLAASRYDRWVTTENKSAKDDLLAVEGEIASNTTATADQIMRKQQALERMRGHVAGIYTIGQPRVGDKTFTEDFNKRFGERHVRIINNRDIVPRVPFRSMNYDHSGTVLYFDEFGRLHRDPGLWYRLLDTLVISRAEVAKAKEGVLDHSSTGYVDLLDKARKNKSALSRLAVS